MRPAPSQGRGPEWSLTPRAGIRTPGPPAKGCRIVTSSPRRHADAVIDRKEVKGMQIRLRHTLAGIGLAGVLVGGGAAVASAATSGASPTTTASSSSSSAPSELRVGRRRRRAPRGSPETPPSGTGSSKAPPSGGSSHCTHMGAGIVNGFLGRATDTSHRDMAPGCAPGVLSRGWATPRPGAGRLSPP